MFLYSKWLSLPINTRHKIASEFGIPKKTPTHVQDNIIISDGYNIKDVEAALSSENLNRYLGGIDESNLETLWDLFIEKIENPNVDMFKAHESNVVNVPVIKVKKSYYKPKSKTNAKAKETNSGKN